MSTDPPPPPPGSVEHMKEFWFLNCPECTFKTQSEKGFETHAVENHPSSSCASFFGSDKDCSDEIEIKDFKIEHQHVEEEIFETLETVSQTGLVKVNKLFGGP